MGEDGALSLMWDYRLHTMAGVMGIWDGTRYRRFARRFEVLLCREIVTKI